MRWVGLGCVMIVRHWLKFTSKTLLGWGMECGFRTAMMLFLSLGFCLTKHFCCLVVLLFI